MNIEKLRVITKRYKTLHKLDSKNELLSYILIYKTKKKINISLVRQHDFFENFGGGYNPEIMLKGKKEIIEYLVPAIRNYKNALDNEIKTIEDRILNDMWGIKI